MTYSLMQLEWLFFIYSFVGWCIEVCAAALHHRKFVNRGFVGGPLCPIYGFGSILFAVFLPELKDNVFFLFLGGLVLATILEYSTGMLFEKIFHRKLWDYSGIRHNIGGYVCLPCSLLWGILAVCSIRFFNPLLCRITAMVPSLIALIVLWALSILLLLDFITSSIAVLGMKAQAKQLAQLSEGIRHTSVFLENALTKYVQKRMQKSFPSIDINAITKDIKAKMSDKEEGKAEVFAPGCSFYKLVALFFVGAFLGDITETVFCLITTGKLMSRSSVVYGPFSIVWGLGCAFLTLFLYRYRSKNDSHIFLAGTLLGGAYEYVCSIFTELVFGTVFWDYSGFTFNLGGRINLLYCFFWGIAAVVWLKHIYPRLSALIERIPKRFGVPITNFMIVFMIVNMIISSLALSRYTDRNTEPNAAPSSEMEQLLNDFLDERFPDERMERIYPNAKIVE